MIYWAAGGGTGVGVGDGVDGVDMEPLEGQVSQGAAVEVAGVVRTLLADDSPEPISA